MVEELSACVRLCAVCICGCHGDDVAVRGSELCGGYIERQRIPVLSLVRGTRRYGVFWRGGGSLSLMAYVAGSLW